MFQNVLFGVPELHMGVGGRGGREGRGLHICEKGAGGGVPEVSGTENMKKRQGHFVCGGPG